MSNIQISPKGTNITGMYRKCQSMVPSCDTLVSCPYTHCTDHWIAKAMSENSSMKEIIPLGVKSQ